MMFDLPQPLGPTTAAMLLGKFTVVGSTKDLNPASLMHLSRTFRPPSGQKPPDRNCAGHRPSARCGSAANHGPRSEEHTSELQSLMRISCDVFCLTKNNKTCHEQQRYARRM